MPVKTPAERNKKGKYSLTGIAAPMIAKQNITFEKIQTITIVDRKALSKHENCQITRHEIVTSPHNTQHPPEFPLHIILVVSLAFRESLLALFHHQIMDTICFVLNSIATGDRVPATHLFVLYFFVPG
jgi:hypothetical protein